MSQADIHNKGHWNTVIHPHKFSTSNKTTHKTTDFNELYGFKTRIIQIETKALQKSHNYLKIIKKMEWTKHKGIYEIELKEENAYIYIYL